MKRAILSVFFILALAHGAGAQAEDPALVWKSIKWAFPAPGMVALELEGGTAYRLGENAYGFKREYNGRELRVVMFAPKVAAAAELVHIQDPKGMPDVDKFLAALAVELAVETPADFTNKYLGSGKLDGRPLYLFETKSGANVGAQVSEQRSLVLVMPAPSAKKTGKP